VNFENDFELLVSQLNRHHIKQNGDDGCWLWTGQVRETKGNGSGSRGRIILGKNTKNRRSYIAHRAAYRVWVGDIPEGFEVCHECDVSLCIRPDHLFAGTHFDNMKDASEKCRIRNGRWAGSAFKLSDAEVEAIRNRRAGGESGLKLAKEYGVCHTQIYRIAAGKRR
jgi:hypothetical protein